MSSPGIPAEGRKKLLEILNDPSTAAVGVESCRAIARSAKAAEALAELAVANGVQIHCWDAPDLFQLAPTPQQSLQQRLPAQRARRGAQLGKEDL
jgi:hypothetical protein